VSIGTAIAAINRVESNLLLLTDAVDGAMSTRVAAQPAVAEALGTAANALSCEWIVEMHEALHDAVCVEVVGGWALLALLLPCIACALLLDATHARWLVAPPALRCAPLCSCCKRVQEATDRKAKALAAELARLEAEAEAERQRLEKLRRERLARHWERNEKRSAGLRHAFGFADGFVNDRVEQAHKSAYFDNNPSPRLREGVREAWGPTAPAGGAGGGGIVPASCFD
jgi:hypothetical protein